MRVQVSYSVSGDEFNELERAKDLMSQKLGRSATINDVCVSAVKTLLQKIDPLKKSCPPSKTENLSTIKKRKVHHNHQSQCTHINDDGQRCSQQRHLDIHHLIPKSEGGTDAIENLTLLCSGHHRAHHQMERQMH